MSAWILAHPYQTLCICTGIIMLALLVSGKLRPIYRLIVFGLMALSAYLILTKSPEEGSNDFRKADTIRILATNHRALNKWKREAGSFPPAGARGLTDLYTSQRGVYLKDAWGRDLRYELRGGAPRMISAGADGRFGTADDVIR